MFLASMFLIPICPLESTGSFRLVDTDTRLLQPMPEVSYVVYASVKKCFGIFVDAKVTLFSVLSRVGRTNNFQFSKLTQLHSVKLRNKAGSHI